MNYLLLHIHIHITNWIHIANEKVTRPTTLLTTESIDDKKWINVIINSKHLLIVMKEKFIWCLYYLYYCYFIQAVLLLDNVCILNPVDIKVEKITIQKPMPTLPTLTWFNMIVVIINPRNNGPIHHLPY